MSRKITGKMLKQLVEEVIRGELPEQQPLLVQKPEAKLDQPPIQAKSLGDVPKAWETDDRPVSFDLENFDWRSEEEIFTDQVRYKWQEFYKNLTQRERAVLRSLLGFDVKRYSVDELEKLQSALKGK